MSVVLALHVACTANTGFQCGVRHNDNPQAVQICNKAQQVCVCQVNGCATQVPVSDCPSGLRFAEAPFAPAKLATTCVDPAIAVWTVDQTEQPNVCTAPPDAASDAPSVTDGPSDMGAQ